MPSQKCKPNIRNLPTNVTRLFYQFYEPSKLLYDSSKLT